MNRLQCLNGGEPTIGDVFGEQLLEPGYETVERIAAVVLSITRT